MLKINNIKYPITDVKITYDMLVDYIYKYISKKLKPKDLSEVKLVKKSIDARTETLYYVLSATFKCSNENVLLKNKQVIKYTKPNELTELENLSAASKKKVLIVGMGPSGLFNAYILNKAGMDVTIIDRGGCVEERIESVNRFFDTGILDENSNIQFGEGGAGTFSDGKLGTNVDSPYTQFIFECLVKYGADPSILYEAKPHVGTDILRKVIVNLRCDLIKNGVKFYFNTKLIDFNQTNASVESKKISSIEFDYLVLAVGHSATDIYELLKKKQVAMEPKNFAMGVRIEHLQSEIDKVQYHNEYLNLPPSEYKLVAHLKDRSVYTFCMCPGGYVVNASSENGHLVTNGMSNKNRDSKQANSAVLVNVNIDDYFKGDILDGAYFLKEYERKAYNKYGNNIAPVQLVKDFLSNVPSTSLGRVIPSIKPSYKLGTINDVMPEFVYESLKEGLLVLDKKIPGFACDDAVITALETRSSAPVKVNRNENFTTSLVNVYAIGEGSGYAGGITTSAIDGIKAAIKLIQNDRSNYGK